MHPCPVPCTPPSLCRPQVCNVFQWCLEAEDADHMDLTTHRNTQAMLRNVTRVVSDQMLPPVYAPAVAQYCLGVCAEGGWGEGVCVCAEGGGRGCVCVC